MEPNPLERAAHILRRIDKAVGNVRDAIFIYEPEASEIDDFKDHVKPYMKSLFEAVDELEKLLDGKDIDGDEGSNKGGGGG